MILTIKFYLSFGHFSHYVLFFLLFLKSLSVGFSWTLVLKYKKKKNIIQKSQTCFSSVVMMPALSLPGITISREASPIWYLKASGHKQALYKTCPNTEYLLECSHPGQTSAAIVTQWDYITCLGYWPNPIICSAHYPSRKYAEFNKYYR